jgi:hypothetical protein
MDESLKSIIPGVCAGMITNEITNSLFATLFIAFLTGMVAYIGQLIIKWVIKEIKKFKI